MTSSEISILIATLSMSETTFHVLTCLSKLKCLKAQTNKLSVLVPTCDF